tara:strand:+ start:856 stop:1350 length:495 start_codon:yes stop_codon:yes gene_type:complete
MIYRPYSINKATTIKIPSFRLWIHCIEYLEDKKIWKIYYDRGTKTNWDWMYGYLDFKSSSYASNNDYITIEGVDFPPPHMMRYWPKQAYVPLNQQWNTEMKLVDPQWEGECDDGDDCKWDSNNEDIQLNCLWSRGYIWQKTKEWGLWLREKATLHNQLKSNLKF